MTNGAGWRSRLLSDYWFTHLPADLQDSLLDAARQRRKTPGKLLFEKGDPPCGLYVLLEGTVRMGAAHEQRLTPRLAEVRPPYWFGEVSLFDGMPRMQDAYSVDQTIFLHIPQETLIQCLENNPQHWRAFEALLSQKLGLALPAPEKLKQLPARAQVAWRLLLLCEGYGNLSHARRLIALDDIHAMETLSLSRAALLEELEDLQQRKIVRLGDEQLEVFDVLGLRKVANYSRAKVVS
ncbi:Cyclic nucleotide-binding protein [Pseudomonas cichorii]|uniref:Cyclic nucleotide-binding protein n=1 Tax=Pseudomonas cichorii TaxID=36746 RepID=A0A3M4LLD2_PSECI|nr:Crp/Fnr family transcriptional regulator [Pseudomonas cichorii]RMQ42247.1 Cyclic nucleotide-binding protein [Pseudomonas cichorii]